MKVFLGILTLGLSIFSTSSHAKSRRSPESIIAAYAAHCGTNRVAKDSGDKTGQLLLSAALKMDPENETALLTTALLKRDQPVQPIEGKYTEEKLLKLLIKRADGLYEKTLPKNKEAGNAARFYYLLAEKLAPSDREIILGLAKLGQKGYKDSLKTMIANDTIIPDYLNQPSTKPNGPSTTRRPPMFEKPKKKVNGFGVGEGDTFLVQRYGKIRSQKFIVKPHEYILNFYHDSQSIEAYFNFGKCRWVRFPYSYWYSSTESILEKKLGVGKGDEFGWISVGGQKYESKDNKYVAFIDEFDRLNIWEKKWHSKHK